MTDFSAFLKAFDAQMESFKSAVRLEIHTALVKGVAWIMGTFVVVTGIQVALLSQSLSK